MKKSIFAGGTKSRNVLLLSIIIAISTGLMIYAGSVNKPILNGDELGSFISANQETGNRLEFWSRSWYDGRLFTDAYSVMPGECFGYGKVWTNQADDVHPPLWYAALHTICSFFPGEFSKWFSLAVNILCIPLSIILFYKTTLLLNQKHEKYALFASFVYGISIGTIKVVLFLRMYTLMQLWCMLALYLHLRVVKEEKLRWYDYILLGAATLLGTLTHYYFLAFLFILALCFGIYLLKNKRFREAILYCVTMAVTAATSIAIYPAMLKHIFGGYRGDETINNLKGGIENFIGAFKTISREVLTDIFGNAVVGTIVILIVVIFVLVTNILQCIKWFRQKKDTNLTGASQAEAFQAEAAVLQTEEKNTHMRLRIAVIVLVSYYLLIIKATPIQDFRYFAPVYPLIIMVTLLELYRMARKFIPNKAVTYVVLLIIALIPTTVYLIRDTPIQPSEAELVSEEYADNDLVLILHDPADGVTNYIALSNYYQIRKYNKFYIIYETELEPITDATLLTEKQLVVTLYNAVDEDAMLEFMKKSTGLKQTTYLYSGEEGDTDTYLLSK